MRGIAIALVIFMATQARADVEQAVQDVILPGYAAFAEATADLADQAVSSCDPSDLQAPWNTAFDAWLSVAHLRLGPVEKDGRALAIAFWPDPKALGAKAQQALIDVRDPALQDAAAFAEVSVAARGLFGLERLLYPADPAFAGPAACDLIRATAADLSRMAADVSGEWQAEFAQTLLTAGQAENTTYLSQDEARRALLTAIVTGLEFNADQRLGRPLGEFDRPRPERAEAQASARSARNVALSMQGLERLALALVPDAPLTKAAFERAQAALSDIEDPIFAGVANPQGRLMVEIAQQAVVAVRDTILAELVPALGVGLGFNAADGD